MYRDGPGHLTSNERAEDVMSTTFIETTFTKTPFISLGRPARSSGRVRRPGAGYTIELRGRAANEAMRMRAVA